MDDLIDYMDIPHLLVKDFHGEMTSEEKVRLDAWLDDDTNQVLYGKLRGQKNGWKRDYLIRKLNKKSAWKWVDRKTGGKQTRFAVRILRYAAMIIVPLVTVVFAFYLFREEPRKQFVEQVERGIKSGEVKAELTLATGECLFLQTGGSDSLTREEGVDIFKEQDGIFYRGRVYADTLVYNSLRVPRGGEFKITLQDGTVVYLNSETVLRYPVQFVGNERRVYLSGEAYFDVERDENKPFIVDMKGSQIEVLGTRFNVRSYEDEENQLTTLVAGKVLLTSGECEGVKLFPGEQGVVNRRGNMKKMKVDTYPYTAWKEGLFVFRKQRLEDIMKIVERWYDVKVFFSDEKCKDVSFTGDVQRYDGFDKLVDKLETTGSVKFEIDGNVIYITKNK